MVTASLPCMKVTAGADPGPASTPSTWYDLAGVQDSSFAVPAAVQVARTEPPADDSVRTSACGCGVAVAVAGVGEGTGVVGVAPVAVAAGVVAARVCPAGRTGALVAPAAAGGRT